MKLNDSFELLRDSEFQYSTKPNPLQIKNKELLAQIQTLKEENRKLQKDHQKLSQAMEEYRQSINEKKAELVEKKEELRDRMLEINQLRSEVQKAKIHHNTILHTKTQEIKNLEKQSQNKDKQILEIRQRLIDAETKLQTEDEFKKTIFQSIQIPDMKFEHKLIQLTEDLQKSMQKQVQSNKTIQKQKQQIARIKKQLKTSKARYIKVQIEYQGLLEEKEAEVVNLKQLIKKYRESRSKIKVVFQLEDTIKREYVEELGKVEDKGQVKSRKVAIDKRLMKIVEAVGTEAANEILMGQ